MIVIESLDRLARDVIIQSVLIKRCIDAGVLLFAANAGENVCNVFLSDSTQPDPRGQRKRRAGPADGGSQALPAR